MMKNLGANELVTNRMRFRRSFGFTLIELMVVVGILVILATIAVPNLVPLLENRRLAGAADAIVAELHFARSESIKQSMDMYALIDIDPARDERWVVALAGRRLNGLNFAENCDAWGDGGTPCNLELLDVTVVGNDPVPRRVIGGDFRGVDIEVVAPTGATDADRGVRFDFVRGLARRIDEGAGVPGWQYHLTVGTGRELQVRVNALGRAWVCQPGVSGRYPTC